MPDSISDFLSSRKPTSDRPLLGHTVLLVEDSRFASEAMRLLCLRSGARIRRADSLKSAKRHLRTYCPTVLIVDLGLPDGSGLSLIDDLHRTPVGIGIVLATSGDPALAQSALAAGADGFLEKPVTSVAAFQEAILRRLPSDLRPDGPRLLSDETVSPDRLALRDDLDHMRALLTHAPDSATLRYATQFLSALARTAEDTQLQAAVRDLDLAQARGAPVADLLDALTGLCADRLKDRAVV